jgi:hypothetical protein
MRLMCWDVDIVHQPDVQLIDANYWSLLGADLNFDPLYLKYLEITGQTRQSNPAPMDLPMCPENMPYYCGLTYRNLLLKKRNQIRIIFRVSFLNSLCWKVEDTPLYQTVQLNLNI